MLCFNCSSSSLGNPKETNFVLHVICISPYFSVSCLLLSSFKSLSVANTTQSQTLSWERENLKKEKKRNKGT